MKACAQLITAEQDYGMGSSYKIVEMTIPKGAVYFTGANNEIVSNKLVTGSLEAL